MENSDTNSSECWFRGNWLGEIFISKDARHWLLLSAGLLDGEFPEMKKNQVCVYWSRNGERRSFV